MSNEDIRIELKSIREEMSSHERRDNERHNEVMGAISGMKRWSIGKDEKDNEQDGKIASMKSQAINGASWAGGAGAILTIIYAIAEAIKHLPP